MMDWTDDDYDFNGCRNVDRKVNLTMTLWNIFMNLRIADRNDYK